MGQTRREGSSGRHSRGAWRLVAPLVVSLASAAAAGSHTIRLECEDFDGPWREQTNILGYSGRGFVVSNANGVAQTYMSARAQIPTSGEYHVWARGWEGSGVDRSWRVQVGETLLKVTHSARRGQRFSWQRCGQVELPAGGTEIRILDAGDSYEVADAIVLTTDPDYDPDAEERRWLVLDPGEAHSMVFDEIMARTRACAAAIPVCRSRGEWQARAAELRPRVLRALGLDPLPERRPLNARVLGETQFDGYRVQRVTFESRPGMVVTANVYVPEGERPFPLVLCPVGHWRHAKAEPTAAARSHALAKLGYITITYDPFGQGERAIAGNSHQEHWRLVLSGHGNVSIMVWDTVRALDYMLTRSDVDASRIACTGASGGGLNTLYLSVVDERLDVAMPVVYITQWADFFSTGVQHCPCSHVPGLGAFTDMGEITALFAPRPQMYMDAADDPQFLTLGARRAEAQARAVYELLGAGDRLLLRSFPGGHDYGQEMRETLYGFLAQHLLGTGEGQPVPEPTTASLPTDSAALRCFEGGKIPSTSKTVRQFALEWAEAAAGELPGPADFDAAATRAAITEALHPPSGPAPKVETVEDFEAGGLAIRKLRLSVQPGIVLPGLFAACEAGAPAVVIADGSPEPHSAEPLLRAAQEVGLAALYVSPRGHGPTAWDEHVICTDNLLLGDSILGQRAFDLVQARRSVRSVPEVGEAPVGLLARGADAGLYGLFAQAMWGEYNAAAVGPMMGTYFEAFGPGIPLAAHVSGMLFAADIPHVAGLAAEHPLWVAFTHSEYQERYPEWVEHLGQQATVADSLPVEEAIRWLGEQLRLASRE